MEKEKRKEAEVVPRFGGTQEVEYFKQLMKEEVGLAKSSKNGGKSSGKKEECMTEVKEQIGAVNSFTSTQSKGTEKQVDDGPDVDNSDVADQSKDDEEIEANENSQESEEKSDEDEANDELQNEEEGEDKVSVESGSNNEDQIQTTEQQIDEGNDESYDGSQQEDRDDYDHEEESAQNSDNKETEGADQDEDQEDQDKSENDEDVDDEDDDESQQVTPEEKDDGEGTEAHNSADEEDRESESKDLEDDATDSPIMSPENEQETQQEDTEDAEENQKQITDQVIENITKEQFANETFRGPILNSEERRNEDEKDLQIDNQNEDKSLDDQEKNRTSPDNTANKEEKLNLLHANTNSFESPQSQIKGMLNGEVGAEAHNQFLSTASFKLHITSARNPPEKADEEKVQINDFSLSKQVQQFEPVENELEIQKRNSNSGNTLNQQNSTVMQIQSSSDCVSYVQMFQQKQVKPSLQIKKHPSMQQIGKALPTLKQSDIIRRSKDELGNEGQTNLVKNSMEKIQAKGAGQSNQEKAVIDTLNPLFSENLIKKKQSGNLNSNMMSYQTANFGIARDTMSASIFGGIKQTDAGESQKANQDQVDQERFKNVDSKLSRYESNCDENVEGLGQTMTEKMIKQPLPSIFENKDERQEEKQPQDDHAELSKDLEAKKLVVEIEQNIQTQIKETPNLSSGESNDAILPDELKQQMNDSSNNWQLRTALIDQMHVKIQDALKTRQLEVLEQFQSLLDFFVPLLNDPNFKIVLTTLIIINLLIGIPQHLNQTSQLTSKCLGQHIPRLIGKLSDSKNIIRQQSIRALVTIFQIMKEQSQLSIQNTQIGGQQKVQNNFVQLVLPYLVNSNSWHIREKLLYVIVICFLKTSKVEANDFDPYAILNVLLKMLNDQKERIRFTAIEAIVAFVNLGNHEQIKDIIKQLSDESIYQLIVERLKAHEEMNPYLTENGALELPYLEHVEEANQQNTEKQMRQTSRREGLNSGPAGQYKNSTQQTISLRGNSSGRKYGGPPSDNSLSNVPLSRAQSKRTASANNPNQLQYTNDTSITNSQIQTTIGYSAHHNNKKFMSPHIGGGIDSGYSQQHQTTNTRSDFGSAITTHNENMYASSKRAQISRQSHERGGQNSNSFLPQLMNNSAQMGPQSVTPTQYMFHPLHGASAGRPHGGSNHLNNMLFGNLPQSENRFHSNLSEPGNSFYHYKNASNLYNRKVSANSHNQAPMPFITRGSNNQNQMQINGPPHNLSNHPIKFLQDGPALTDPLLSPHQQHPFNDFMSRKFKNQLSMEDDTLSEISNFQNLQITQPPQLASLGVDSALIVNSYMRPGQLQPISKQGSGPMGIPQRSSNNQQDLKPGSKHNSRSGFMMHPHMAQGDQSSMQLSSQHSYYSRGGERTLPSRQSNLTSNEQMTSSDGGPIPVNFTGRKPDDRVIMQPDSYMQSNLQQPQIMFQNNQGVLPMNQFVQRGAAIQLGPNGLTKNGSNLNVDGTALGVKSTSTAEQVANQLKQKQLRQQQLQRSKLAMAQVYGTEEGMQPMTAESMGIFAVNGRGPIKAMRQVELKSQESSQSLKQQLEAGSSLQDKREDSKLQELCIDSRRPKRPMGSSSYEFEQEEAEMGKYIDNYQGQKPQQQQFGSKPNSRRESRISAATRKRTANTANQKQDEKDKGDGFEVDGLATASFKMMDADDNRDIKRSTTAGMTSSSLHNSKVTYISADELQPIEGNASIKFKQAFNNLISSSDWIVQFEACNTIRSVCKFHQDLVVHSGATLHSLVKQLCKLADSLRSSLAKIALVTVRDMFQFLKRCMETYLDPLIKILLKKVQDTSSFISDEAEAALITMTVNCSERRVLLALLQQQVSQKSAQQKLRICNCLTQLVQCLGNNILFFKESDKLLVQLATYLQDASQAVRSSAKRGFIYMQNAVMGQNDSDKLLQRVLSEFQYKKVKSFLDNEAQSFIMTDQQVPQAGTHSIKSDFVIRTATSTVGTSNNQHNLQSQATTSTGGGAGPSTSQAAGQGSVRDSVQSSLQIKSLKIYQI